MIKGFCITSVNIINAEIDFSKHNRPVKLASIIKVPPRKNARYKAFFLIDFLTS